MPSSEQAVSLQPVSSGSCRLPVSHPKDMGASGRGRLAAARNEESVLVSAPRPRCIFVCPVVEEPAGPF
eukprot:746988-Hanusia_phi.AAC.2